MQLEKDFEKKIFSQRKKDCYSRLHAMHVRDCTVIHIDPPEVHALQIVKTSLHLYKEKTPTIHV